MDKEDFFKKIGRQVRKFRKKRNLSQESLAELIGKSDDTISNIERGVFPPRMETVLDLAEALEVVPYELLMIDDMEPSDRERFEAIEQITDLLREKPIELIQSATQQIQTMISFHQNMAGKK